MVTKPVPEVAEKMGTFLSVAMRLSASPVALSMDWASRKAIMSAVTLKPTSATDSNRDFSKEPLLRSLTV